MGGAKTVDFGTQAWYTRLHLARKKCLILLSLCERRGNPSLFPPRQLKRLSKIDI